MSFSCAAVRLWSGSDGMLGTKQFRSLADAVRHVEDISIVGGDNGLKLHGARVVRSMKALAPSRP